MKKILALLLAVLLLTAGCAAPVPEGSLVPRDPTAAATEAAALPSTAAPETPETAEAPVTTEAAATSPETTAPATDAPVTEAPETEPPAPTGTTAASPSPDSRDPWSCLGSLLYSAGVYTNSSGNAIDYSFDLPRIEDDREGALSINEEIDREIGEQVRASLEAIENDEEIGLTQVGFYADVWADVLTLVLIERYYYMDWEDYAVYSYETSTGRRLTTETLLEKKGVSQQDFLAAASYAMRTCFEEKFGGIPEDKREEYGYNFAYGQIDEYVNMDLMAYPNASGDIVIIAPIPSIAGPAYLYEPLPLGLVGN